MKVSEIATRLIDEMSDEGDVYVSIKALVENDKSDPEVGIMLQGVDEEGFCLHEFYLSGDIDPGGSRVLTAVSYLSRASYGKIIQWQPR
ncbi:MAG: hypothetical protein VYB34_14620 [Planctomycetota bacterium]|nr:hypothetical protein [Planctomycetota bacterium]|tara:strand:- start:195 stop:461 length:267 start_codon:yes stop_codon:yes gene_type:complete